MVFASGQATPSRAQVATQEYVVVQYAGPSSVQRASSGDDDVPTLAEQGYATLAVPAGMTQAEYLAKLQADPAIASAQPDAKVYAAYTPNDTHYSTYQQSYLSTIGASTAWDYATGNGEVIIAILDTGVDINHPDFEGRLWVNPAEIAGNGLDDDNNGCIDDVNGCRFINITPQRMAGCAYTAGPPRGLIRDDHGRAGSGFHSHGTLVAGVAGAAGNNAKGVTGMAWNAKIMVVKVLDCGSRADPETGEIKSGLPSGDMSNIAEGIEYARRMGANVINLSLASEPGDLSADQPVLRTAIESAQAAGILIVAAAGNHSGAQKVQPGYPAAYTQYPAVVGVGASDSTMGNTWYNVSNYGPGVDFAAPGRSIAGPTRTDIGTNTYGTDSGTSFAAPLVTGMFALMISRNERLSIADYLQIATQTATPPIPAEHGGNWAGAGIINAGAALARIPMLVTGSALHDWQSVPVGTQLRASIDGMECGSATTTMVGSQTRFTLRVRAEAEQAGCGAAGKTVDIAIGGLPATSTYTWPERDGDLGFGNAELSTLSDPPGGIIVQSLQPGWNLVANLEAPGNLPSVLAYLPDAWEEVAAWNTATNRYDLFSRNVPDFANSLSSIAQYSVFWVRGSTGNVASLNPQPASREVSFQPGWNAFLYTGTSKAATDALESISGKYEELMHFDNTTRKWLSFAPGQPRSLNTFGGLLPFRTYWIHVTEPATLVME